jgi:hypothetical protein
MNSDRQWRHFLRLKGIGRVVFASGAQAGTVTDAIASCAMPLRSALPEDDARILLGWVACEAHAD